MAWVVLIVAALTDVAMAVALKYTDRWKCFWPSLLGLLFVEKLRERAVVTSSRLTAGTMIWWTWKPSSDFPMPGTI